MYLLYHHLICLSRFFDTFIKNYFYQCYLMFKRENELKNLQKKNASEEDINLKRQEINDLFSKINELMSESPHNLL